MNDPKIRFKGYTEAWEQRKFKNVFDFLQNNSLSRAELSNEEGEILNVHYGDVLVKYGDVLDVKIDELTYLIDSSFADKYQASFLQNGDIIIADAAEDETVGKCSEIAGLTTECVLSGLHTIPCRPTIKFAENYLGYYMNSGAYHDQLLPLIQGTKISSISKAMIQETTIIYPKSEMEQKNIGAYFRNIDNLITLHQRKCEQTKKLKKYMLQKMFPKNGENVPEIRFSGFTDAWEQRKLGDIAYSFEYGLNAAAKEFDGINKYIRITDIDDDSHLFIMNDLTSPDIDLSDEDNYKLSEGDILFARTGASVGKTYIYKPSDGLVYYAGFLIRTKIREEYNAEFVFQNTLTEKYYKYIAVTSQRSGQPGVNAQEYAEYKIFVPCRSEQDKISEYLRSLDNLITLHQRKCDELNKIKKFMLQNMFV